MGNTCGKGGGKSRVRSPVNDLSEAMESPNLNPEEMDEQRINKLINDTREYHKYRMKNELENDPHTFILDNILMCIQFFDNFEKSIDTANKFKRDIEREMAELLARDSQEGTILGDRRLKLLTGMSDVLAQNYIYRGKNPTEEDDEADLYYGGMGFKDTFLAEGILPLEFTMTWDNLEVYDVSEWDDLKEYSHAKGAPPIARFCMEQPDKKMHFPHGYIRLRCVDEPITELIHSPTESDDPLYSKPYSDGLPEIISESEPSPANSGPTSEDEDDEISKLSELIKLNTDNFQPPANRTKAESIAKTLDEQNHPSTSSNNQNGFTASRSKHLKLQMPLQLPTERNQQFPTFTVHAPTPPVTTTEFSYEMDRKPYRNPGSSFPHSQHGRILKGNSKSTPNLLLPSRDSPGKETSSGYDTTSTRSRSSSMVSEMMRDKWQKLNLKKLWEFGKKSRKDEILSSSGKYDPLPRNCYSEVKYEFSLHDTDGDDDDDDDFDDFLLDSDTDSEDNDSAVGHSNKRKRRRNGEEDYEMRFYLNSLQVSSNACSEFHYIGPKLSIPPNSMSNGVVLGTTIRCPIPYASPSNGEEANVGSYFVTYAFTPSLHSKSWPEGLLPEFKKQVISYAAKRNLHGEMWPSLDQMEEIKLVGCNAIPLGYRSIDFFNAEQILEWELNFQDCEALLLNSFRSEHWRAYIFASILFRAFIAPLGPQGVGFEHIRNILYFMCHENLSGWNNEQPGVHLRILLDNLYNCLSRDHMPSFFVRSRNLLQSIPPHNIRFVQGHLKHIRENLIVYSLYAFRNLMDVRQTKTKHAFPDLKSLYEILTVEEAELLQILNPGLRMQKDVEDEEQQEKAKKMARKQKKSQTKRPNLNLIQQQDLIDREYFASEREKLKMAQPQPRRDKYNERVRNKYRKYEKQLEDQRSKTREMQKLERNPELRLPDSEKRKSIDLKKTPVIPKNFTPFRILLTIQFFLKQFLKMAEKATEFQSYDQATMYILQVENLCEIAVDEKFRDVLPPFQDGELEHYRTETLRLRAIIGKDMQQYVLARLTLSRSPSQPSLSLPSLPGFPVMTHFPTFTNNWDLRKVPSPPPSTNEIRPSGKTLSKPNIVNSLQSLESIPPPTNPNHPSIPVRSPSTPSLALSVVEEILVTENHRVAPRRQESIKFVSPVVHRAMSGSTPSPSTPTRKNRGLGSKTLSRESTFSLSLDHEDTESTDL